MVSSSRKPVEPPIIALAQAPGERLTWDRPPVVVYAWSIVELLFVTNPWQISSRLRVGALRLFGAKIARGVVMRPRIRVRFPWKLQIGEDSWIGEGVWIHNQDEVMIGANAVLSQETFITTGSHAHRRDMALVTRPVVVEDGVWVTSRCIVLGGSVIARSALVTPLSVISGHVPSNSIATGNPAQVVGKRFEDGDE